MRERNILKEILVVVMLIVSISVFFLIKNNTDPAYEGSGKIDIGGYELFIRAEGNGKPVVVFETGLNGDFAHWQNVAGEINKYTKTVIYDRAGIGLSDISPYERTSEVKARELHTLLQRANIKPPYILVGHSLGGHTVRIFAAKYPKEVAGIVLVDVSHEDADKKIKPLLTAAQLEEQMKFEEDINKTSKDGKIKDFEISDEQVRATRNSLRNIPLTVIAARETIGYYPNNIWLDLQTDLASLSKNGKLIIAENSGHVIQADEPQVVIDAVLDMLKKK
ncbi:MAG: alpha/beta fold hydrolase [Bacillota bacterium]